MAEEGKSMKEISHFLKTSIREMGMTIACQSELR